MLEGGAFCNFKLDLWLLCVGDEVIFVAVLWVLVAGAFEGLFDEVLA